MADSAHEQYEFDLEALLKELVEDESAGYDRGYGYEADPCCIFCWEDMGAEPNKYPHTDDCLITRARKLLR